MHMLQTRNFTCATNNIVRIFDNIQSCDETIQLFLFYFILVPFFLYNNV